MSKISVKLKLFSWNYFPEILFSVAAKHAGFTENDFQKRFTADSNAALISSPQN